MCLHTCMCVCACASQGHSFHPVLLFLPLCITAHCCHVLQNLSMFSTHGQASTLSILDHGQPLQPPSTQTGCTVRKYISATAVNSKRTWSLEVLALDHRSMSIIAEMAYGAIQSMPIKSLWHRLFTPWWSRTQPASQEPGT